MTECRLYIGKDNDVTFFTKEDGVTRFCEFTFESRKDLFRELSIAKTDLKDYQGSMTLSYPVTLMGFKYETGYFEAWDCKDDEKKRYIDRNKQAMLYTLAMAYESLYE